MKSIVRWIAVLAMMLGVAAVAPSASATTPGADGLITFVRAGQVYTISPTSGPAVKLTTSGRNSAPAWSPDGTLIAYVHQAGKRRDIWLMNADGSNKRAITTSGRVVMGPAWSPDGTRIAFADSTNRLLWVNVAQPGLGTPFLGYYTGPWGDDVPENATEMYINANAVRALAWSGDNTIAFVGNYDAQLDFSLQNYDVDTLENRQVWATGGGCCGFLRWSDFSYGPANQLAYGEVEFDLASNVTLPSAVVYAPVAYNRNGDGGPAPSPSGQFIAVTNATSGTPTIFIQKLDGSGRRQLTTGAQPDWQHR